MEERDSLLVRLMDSVQRYSSRILFEIPFLEFKRVFTDRGKAKIPARREDNNDKGLSQSTKEDTSLKLETGPRFVSEHKQRHQLEVRDNKVLCQSTKTSI